jgi:tRNA (cmo5U34)-methyltransferase
MAAYRWNSSDFAMGYDAAAHIVHPQYVAIQDEILRLLDGPLAQGGAVVDLGGGSGRLMERILDRFPDARGIVIDQSEPFLALSERRLERFGDRASCILSRLQDDWSTELSISPIAFVSMSAIHHLEPPEKQSLYQRCFDLLKSGGALLNGDEVRPTDDGEYLATLTAWAEHMQREMAAGTIPPTFHDALRGWINRNVAQFGRPKKSGDDCHETIDAQLGYFRSAGFNSVDCDWQHALWAILRGVK